MIRTGQKLSGLVKSDQDWSGLIWNVHDLSGMILTGQEGPGLVRKDQDWSGMILRLAKKFLTLYNLTHLRTNFVLVLHINSKNLKEETHSFSSVPLRDFVEKNTI